MEAASGVGPAGSAHPEQTRSSLGSAAGNRCGRTPGPEAETRFGQINEKKEY